jgi:hypothetical protein
MFGPGAKITVDGREFHYGGILTPQSLALVRDNYKVEALGRTILANFSDGSSIVRTYSPRVGTQLYVDGVPGVSGPYRGLFYESGGVVALVERRVRP